MLILILELSESHFNYLNPPTKPPPKVTASMKNERIVLDYDAARRQWKGTWPVPASNPRCCRCNGAPTCTCPVQFEVTVDCSSADPILQPGQASVLTHMEKLVDDQRFADVTFKFSQGNRSELPFEN